MISLTWNLKKPNIETERNWWFVRGWGVGGNGKMLIKVYRLAVIRGISSGDLLHIMMSTVKNTVLYT